MLSGLHRGSALRVSVIQWERFHGRTDRSALLFITLWYYPILPWTILYYPILSRSFLYSYLHISLFLFYRLHHYPVVSINQASPGYGSPSWRKSHVKKCKIWDCRRFGAFCLIFPNLKGRKMIENVKRRVTGCESMNGHFGEVTRFVISVLAFVHCPRIPRSYPYFCKYGPDDGRRADK